MSVPLAQGDTRLYGTCQMATTSIRHAFQFTLSQQADSEELPVEVTIPDGLKKSDQFFGDIEAYYGQLDIGLSLTTVPGPNARIFIDYQGCADWGFCYPPQRFEFLLSP